MADMNRRKMFGLMLGAGAAAIAASSLMADVAEAAPLGVGPGSVDTPTAPVEKAQYIYIGPRRRWRRRRWRRRRWYYY
jgi:hypothetical protein